jgi:hypothetical protein
MTNGMGKLEEYLEREAKRAIVDERQREMSAPGGMKDFGAMNMPPSRPAPTPGLPPAPAAVGGPPSKAPAPGSFPFGPRKT